MPFKYSSDKSRSHWVEVVPGIMLEKDPKLSELVGNVAVEYETEVSVTFEVIVAV